MKLNLRQTILVGLAFLSINAFWGLYDFTVPLILRDTYQLGDTLSGVVMAMDNVVALALLPLFGALSDKCRARMGRRMPFILFGTVCAAGLTLAAPEVVQHGSLGMFLTVLGLLLLTMSVYRSPAVALMPDVTPRALRSRGNAVINLMGAVGTGFSLLLVNAAVIRYTDASGALRSDYRWMFVGVAVLMLLCVGTMALRVKEPAMVRAREALEEAPLPEKKASAGRLSREAAFSLAMLLCSVSLWFMGYNAVTSAFSKYATQVWHAPESAAANCVLVGTAGAIVSYWPVGVLSSRWGRKRMILTGVTVLMAAFALCGLCPEMNLAVYVLFALIGLGWAAISVNSYPMVVELASGADVGRYTGLYYTFSMAAQVLTPVLSGALLEHAGYWTLFVYAAVMLALAFLTMTQVRHGDSRPEGRRGLEALDVED